MKNTVPHRDLPIWADRIIDNAETVLMAGLLVATSLLILSTSTVSVF